MRLPHREKTMARLLALLLFVRSVAARDCYATIVYGSEPKHVCTAAVLGRALRWLDPWKARVALVSNVAPNASAVLREEYELAPAKWRGDAGRKADLFNGPAGCDRVIYLDADCMPLSSWARIENVWKQLEGGAAEPSISSTAGKQKNDGAENGRRTATEAWSGEGKAATTEL